MLDLREHGAELVIDLLEAANGLEHLTQEEIKDLLRDAAAVLCEFSSPCCPAEARAIGCPRMGANVVSLDQRRHDNG
jgi:hypothetical protein